MASTSFQDLEDFFDGTARQKIASSFQHRCVLCRFYLSADEGHYVPLIHNYYTFHVCLYGSYTSHFKPYDAPNGLYACRSCAHKWLMTSENTQRLAVLIPCIPLMLYALRVLRLANDEASRSQTLDAIFADLDRDQTSTLERRSAAPFLHCYQLHPIEGPRLAEVPESTTLLVWPSPSTYLTYNDSEKRTRYCILEDDERTGSVDMPLRAVPLYSGCGDNAVTLWRIPMRSPGLLFGNAEATVFRKCDDPKLYQVFHDLCNALNYRPGLPDRRSRAPQLTAWEIFQTDNKGPIDLPPSSGLSSTVPPALLPLDDCESSSDSDDSCSS